MVRTLLIGILLGLSLSSNAQFILGATELNIDDVAGPENGLHAPWDLTWGPDDHLWFTDAEYIKRIDPVSYEISTVFRKPRQYALSLAFHPDFENTPQVFVIYDSAVYYSISGTSPVARLLRYDYDSESHTFSNETVLFRYSHAGEHVGGRVIVTQDSKLLFPTGDYEGDLSSSFGKTMRFNLDGCIPDDNPFPDDPTWSWGHRNPQGLVAHPNGHIYSTEHGGFGNELNIIEPGQNYGWPAYDSYICIDSDSCNSPAYQNSKFPIHDFQNPPCGIDWYDHPAIPELQGHLLVAALGFGIDFQGILKFEMNAAGDSVLSSEKMLNTVPHIYRRIRDVYVAPDGSVWFIGNDRADLNITSTGVSSLATIHVMYNPEFREQQVPTDFSGISSEILPNPAKGYFDLRINPDYFSAYDRADFKVYSAPGQLVIQSSVSKSFQRFNIEKLSSGIYFFRIESPDGEHVSIGKLLRD